MFDKNSPRCVTYYVISMVCTLIYLRNEPISTRDFTQLLFFFLFFAFSMDGINQKQTFEGLVRIHRVVSRTYPTVVMETKAQ